MSNTTLSRFYDSSKLRSSSQSSSGGRNDTGHITVRHKGGGHKRNHRVVSLSAPVNSRVVGFSYDPSRNTNLVKVLQGDNFSYRVNSTGTKHFQMIQNFEKFTSTGQQNFMLQAGDKAKLSSFEPGDFVHSVSAFPNGKPIFARAAGTFCQIISIQTAVSAGDKINQNYAIVRLPSGSYRRISINAAANRGTVARPSAERVFSKAGRSRWLGIRPTVRGVAINPVDHPHGGNSFGRPSVTFKSWPTKGQPTRRSKRTSQYILK